MQYTVSYTTTPDHDYLAHVVVTVDWNDISKIPVEKVKAKFCEIFRYCFGGSNILDYEIKEIRVGSHYGPPMRIK
jgi:hypothetical protein